MAATASTLSTQCRILTESWRARDCEKVGPDCPSSLAALQLGLETVASALRAVQPALEARLEAEARRLEQHLERGLQQLRVEFGEAKRREVKGSCSDESRNIARLEAALHRAGASSEATEAALIRAVRAVGEEVVAERQLRETQDGRHQEVIDWQRQMQNDVDELWQRQELIRESLGQHWPQATFRSTVASPVHRPDRTDDRVEIIGEQVKVLEESQESFRLQLLSIEDRLSSMVERVVPLQDTPEFQLLLARLEASVQQRVDRLEAEVERQQELQQARLFGELHCQVELQLEHLSSEHFSSSRLQQLDHEQSKVVSSPPPGPREASCDSAKRSISHLQSQLQREKRLQHEAEQQRRQDLAVVAAARAALQARLGSDRREEDEGDEGHEHLPFQLALPQKPSGCSSTFLQGLAPMTSVPAGSGSELPEAILQVQSALRDFEERNAQQNLELCEATEQLSKELRQLESEKESRSSAQQRMQRMHRTELAEARDAAAGTERELQEVMVRVAGLAREQQECSLSLRSCEASMEMQRAELRAAVEITEVTTKALSNALGSVAAKIDDVRRQAEVDLMQSHMSPPPPPPFTSALRLFSLEPSFSSSALQSPRSDAETLGLRANREHRRAAAEKAARSAERRCEAVLEAVRAAEVFTAAIPRPRIAAFECR